KGAWQMYREESKLGRRVPCFRGLNRQRGSLEPSWPRKHGTQLCNPGPRLIPEDLRRPEKGHTTRAAGNRTPPDHAFRRSPERERIAAMASGARAKPWAERDFNCGSKVRSLNRRTT